MKKILSFLVAVVGFASYASAQCAYNNTSTGSATAPTTVGVSSVLNSCVFGGQYITINNLTVGASYTISTCGDTDFDTQLTLYPVGGGSVIGYNDDFCGAQSSVTFVATTTSIDALVDRYNCVSNQLCMTVNMTLNSLPAPDPCLNPGTIACGVTQSVTLSGAGANWNVTSCGFSTPGAERVYTFTAPYSGVYTLNVSSGTGGFVDWFFKPASAGCSSTGWTCIDDLSSGGTANFTLAAGNYFILADAEGTTTRSQSFSISCTPPVDPCANIEPLACGASATYTLSGGGAGWNPFSCGFSTPGAEKVYSFVAPTSGTYTLNVTSASGGYVDYFYKLASGGCSSTGWTCIDDINGSTSINLTLAAGTYYFLVDGEGTSSRSQTFNIACPPPPPANDDCANAETIVCGQSISGSTLSAAPDLAPSCNGFDVGTGGGVWYRFVGTGGFVTASLCNPGTDYDSKLHVFTGGCTNLVCETADDDGCDSPTLASTVTFCTVQGQEYFFLVTGFLSATGNFVLTMDCTPPAVEIDPIGPFCQSDASVSLTVNYPGGTFSGPGVSGNTFDPAAAGPGEHTISYTVCAVTATLTVLVTATPSNDVCANAAPVACGDVVTGSTICATADTAPICGTTDGTGGGVWYTIEGDGNSYTASLCNGSDYDTKIRVYAGSCGSLDCEDGVDDNCNGLLSTVTWCSQPGTTYFILVHGFGTNEGNYVLEMSCNASAPVISACASDQSANLDSTCSAVVQDYTGLISASDDCGAVIITQTPAPGTVLNGAGTYPLSFVVSDAAGNTDSCSTTLTLYDITLPEAVCQPITVALNGTGNASIVAEDVNNGSSDACGIGSLSIDINSFSCANLGANTVTLTVTDVNGNQSTCTAEVTVVDNTAPSITCPANISVSNDPGQCGAVVNFTVQASDNCSVTVSSTPASGNVFAVGTTTVTATAVDQSNNTSTCSFSVTVTDNEAPAAVCQNITVLLDDNGNASITAQDVDGGSTDNCSVASLSVAPTTFDCSDLGNNTVTLTVTDIYGNSSTCTATVTINEDHFVEITCPADVTTTCETGEGGAYVTWCAPTAVAYNSCQEPCPANTTICGFEYFGEFGGNRYYQSHSDNFTYGEALAAAQAAGGHLVVINSAAENAYIKANMDESYAWIGFSDAVTEGTFRWVNGDAVTYTNWTPGEPNNSDGGGSCCSNYLNNVDFAAIQRSNGKWLDKRGCRELSFIIEIPCGNPYTITQIGGPASGSLFPAGTTTITYVATDNFGTTDTCSFTVTVEDVFEVLCPGDITVECERNNNCGGNNSNQQGAEVNWNDPMVIWQTCNPNACDPNQCYPGLNFLGEHDGHRYYISSSSKSWDEAKTLAENAGGHLVIINNAAENTWLDSKLSTSVWIGLSDQVTEGAFRWVNNTSLGYSNWSPGEPNNSDGSNSCCSNNYNQVDFVTFNGSNGKWADRRGCADYKYVVEISCDSYTLTQTSGPESGDFLAPGTYSVTYLATTTTGDSATCGFNITVESCPLNYCDIEGQCSSYEWIRNVALGNLNNFSGNNGGYANFTQYSATVARGSSNGITLRPGFPGSSHTVYWRVWVDWNQDGDFNDSNEQVYSATGSSTVSGNVSVPNSAVLGSTRMRVAMRYGGYPSSCTDFSYGEVEDYTINVTGPNSRAIVEASGQPESAATEAEGAMVKRSGVEFLEIYPVPVTTNLNLHFLSLQQEKLTVQVLSIDGKVMFQEVREASERDNYFVVDVSQLPMAPYLVRVTNGTESFTEKFVKQ